MTKSARFAVGSLFGPSRSDRLVELFKDLSRTALDCAALFRATKGRDAKGIIEIENKADRIVEQIHELLDNSFIMRFDIPDSMKLTDELDDVVDGMRKVALHLEAYAPFVSELSPDAMEVFALGEEMLRDIDSLIDMMAGRACRWPRCAKSPTASTQRSRKPTSWWLPRSACSSPSMPLPAPTPSVSSRRTSYSITLSK